MGTACHAAAPAPMGPPPGPPAIAAMALSYLAVNPALMFARVVMALMAAGGPSRV